MAMRSRTGIRQVAGIGCKGVLAQLQGNAQVGIKSIINPKVATVQTGDVIPSVVIIKTRQKKATEARNHRIFGKVVIVKAGV